MCWLVVTGFCSSKVLFVVFKRKRSSTSQRVLASMGSILTDAAVGGGVGCFSGIITSTFVAEVAHSEVPPAVERAIRMTALSTYPVVGATAGAVVGYFHMHSEQTEEDSYDTCE